MTIAKEYIDLVDENTGLFDLWKGRLKAAVKKTEALESFIAGTAATIDTSTPRYLYYHTFPEAVYQYKDKESVQAEKVVVERMWISGNSSGIVSLDKNERPYSIIYKEGLVHLTYKGDDKHSFKTNDGRSFTFKENKGNFTLHMEQEDGSYAP